MSSNVIDDAIAAVTRATQEIDRLHRLNGELVMALKRAADTIRAFHGIGLSGPAEHEMWKLYQTSPEMKAINAAIQHAEQGRTP